MNKSFAAALTPFVLLSLVSCGEKKEDKIVDWTVSGSSLGNINCTTKEIAFNQDVTFLDDPDKEKARYKRGEYVSTDKLLKDSKQAGIEYGKIKSYSDINVLWEKSFEESCEVLDDKTIGLSEKEVVIAEDIIPNPAPKVEKASAPKPEKISGSFNKANWDKVTTGMSIQQVQAIIGNGEKGVEIKSTYSDMVTYNWGSIMGGPYASITFNNGVVMSKMALRM